MDYKQLLRGFLDADGKLRQFPSKMKAKVPAMFYIAEQFEKGRQYNEKEVNDIINGMCAFRDPATIRRDMADSKFFLRTTDGRIYQLADEFPKYPELGFE